MGDKMRLVFLLVITSSISFLDKLGDQTYQNLYMINLHPHLSRNGELVFSTNTDPKNFWDNF